jgi:predicted Zn-dependent protease
MSLDGRTRAPGRGRRRWALAGLLATVAVVGLVFAYLRSTGEVRAAARLAREAVAANRADEARRLLDRWAALSPGSGEPDYYRALLEVRSDRPDSALDSMRKAIARGYPEGPLMDLRAVLLARAGKFDEAEPVLARAFESSAEPRAEIAEGLSRIYLKSFRLAETARVLDAWMKAAPEDPRPYLRLNEVDERIDSEPAVLVRNYREALRRDPNLLDARLGLAEKLQEASLFDEAEAEYATLLDRDPGNLRGLVGAGRIALLKGDVPASIRHFEAALAIDPRDKVALRELGLIDLNNGRIPRACSRLAQAVEVDPHDPEVRFSYARALKIAGDEPRAAEQSAATERLKKEQQQLVDLRKSLVEHPDDVDLRSKAARWLIEHGHEQEGLEWTQLILRQHPNHPETCQILADYHTSRGNLGLANYYRLNAPSAPTGK